MAGPGRRLMSHANLPVSRRPGELQESIRLSLRLQRPLLRPFLGFRAQCCASMRGNQSFMWNDVEGVHKGTYGHERVPS